MEDLAMPDPTEAAKLVRDTLDSMGISLSPAVAGFIGSIISLRYLPQLNGWQAWATILTGAAVAGYMSEFIASAFGFPMRFATAIGFFVGLSAMSVLGGLFVLLGELRTSPAAFIRSWFRRDK